MLSAYDSSDAVIFTTRMHQNSPFWAQKSKNFMGRALPTPHHHQCLRPCGPPTQKGWTAL